MSHPQTERRTGKAGLRTGRSRRRRGRRGGRLRIWRWLSEKPLSILVHQLVVGRHHQRHPLKLRQMGGRTRMSTRICHLLPPLIDQRISAGLPDSPGDLRVSRKSGRETCLCVRAVCRWRLQWLPLSGSGHARRELERRPRGCFVVHAAAADFRIRGREHQSCDGDDATGRRPRRQRSRR